jgi:hypothetical protein
MAEPASRFRAPTGPRTETGAICDTKSRGENGEIPMPEYIAGLCRMVGSELVPFDTMRFFADNHDEAVRQAVEWLSSTDTAIDDSAWLQVLCDGSAFFSKEIAQL